MDYSGKKVSGMQEATEVMVSPQSGKLAGVSVKTRLQAVLHRLGIYRRLKSSYLFDFYLALTDKRRMENRRNELEFYRRTLRGFKRQNLIFDIGANVGAKTDVFLRLGARVIAVEPDPTSQEVLRQSYLDFRLVKKPVVIVGKAVSSQAGSQRMWVDEPGSALNTLSTKWVDILRIDESRFGGSVEFSRAREVETTTLDELIKRYGTPFYAKIDVEGYEATVLSGLNTAIPFVSFEVNLPQFRPEALQCIDHLERVAKGGKYNYARDCLTGLALESWSPKDSFVDVLGRCPESSVEVFWMSPDAQG
jgi:FkbM family methyltransferase